MMVPLYNVYYMFSMLPTSTLCMLQWDMSDIVCARAMLLANFCT